MIRFVFLKCLSGANVGNGLGWEKVRLRHRLESEPARPHVIITTLSSKYVSEGELSNIWDYNFLRKDNTPKTGALTTTRIEHYRFSLTEFFKKL